MGIVSGGVYLFVIVVFLPFAFVSCEVKEAAFESALASPTFPLSLLDLVPAGVPIFGTSRAGLKDGYEGATVCHSALL